MPYADKILTTIGITARYCQSNLLCIMNIFSNQLEVVYISNTSTKRKLFKTKRKCSEDLNFSLRQSVLNSLFSKLQKSYC